VRAPRRTPARIRVKLGRATAIGDTQQRVNVAAVFAFERLGEVASEPRVR
jgi:hypothetical protein